jgi:hypothetical protein
MSDETTTPAAGEPLASVPASAVNPVVANAAQALAIKEIGEAVEGVKKQVKRLWISFGVLAVVTLVVAIMTFVPGLRFGLAGRGNFQRGQFNGTFQGAPGATQGGGTGGTQAPTTP